MFFKRRRRPRKRKKETAKAMLIKQIAFGVVLVVLIALLAIATYYFSRIESLTIDTVEVVGGSTISHEVIQSEVNNLLDGTHFSLVPRRFAWTYPHDEIQTQLAERTRIKNIHIERGEEKNLLIVFEEYQPVALWCEKTTSKECLFVDSKGYAFTEAPYLEGSAFMRYSDRGRAPARGLYAFDTDFIATSNIFVENAYDQLALNIIHIEQSAKDEITYYISGGGVIKVSETMTPTETLENLDLILSSEEFGHLAPGNFKYIDLRYGNKIFVNEEIEEAKPAASSSEETKNVNE